jgi:hypothetical protein
MRSITALILAASLLGAALPAAAQRDTVPKSVSDVSLPNDVSERIVAFFNDPQTIRFNGRARIPADGAIDGDVAVMDGPLSVAGTIHGDVVVINGDLELAPGAAVTGSITVVGGEILGAGAARVSGDMVAYSAPLEFARRGERIVVLGPDEREGSSGASLRTRARRPGEAHFTVTTDGSYNRVEGLPIAFGPTIETGGSNPFRLRVRGIFRTEAEGPYGAERWGADVRAEQFLGGRRAVRVGGTVRSVVSPIEDWQISDVENSLSTLIFHRDFRDHYERQGYSVFATLAPRHSPFSGTVELRSESHEPKAAGTPFTLLRNGESWRRQPFAARGDLRSLVASMRWDGRSDPDDPATGWYVNGEVERALRSTLGQPELLVVPVFTDEPLPSGARAAYDYGLFTHGFLDVRRYNRINPTSRLNFRLLAAGSMDGSRLPPQRQHTLGGEGSLPGFGLLSLDCGARATVVSTLPDVFNGRQPTPFYADYGCNRVALLQAEYRGNVDFHVNLGDDDDDEDDRVDFDGVWDGSFGWVFFADAGRGWGDDRLGSVRQDAVDVGAGVLFGRLGIYAAFPVASDGRYLRDDRGPNLFIRLNSRF